MKEAIDCQIYRYFLYTLVYEIGKGTIDYKKKQTKRPNLPKIYPKNVFKNVLIKNVFIQKCTYKKCVYTKMYL